MIKAVKEPVPMNKGTTLHIEQVEMGRNRLGTGRNDQVTRRLALGINPLIMVGIQ